MRARDTILHLTAHVPETMYTTNRDQYRRISTRSELTPLAPRRSCFSKYKYIILFFVAAIITLSILVPIVIVKHIRKAGNAQSEQNLSGWTDDFDITTDWHKSWPETGVTRYVSIYLLINICVLRCDR